MLTNTISIIRSFIELDIGLIAKFDNQPVRTTTAHCGVCQFIYISSLLNRNQADGVGSFDQPTIIHMIKVI